MQKLLIIALALVASASLSTAQAGKKDKKQPKAPKTTVQLTTSSDSLSYAAGYVLAELVNNRFLAGLADNLKGSADSLQMQLAYQGLFDALHGDTTCMKPRPAETYLNNRMSAIQQAKTEKAKAAGIKFLEENRTKEGVTVLPSGLQYKVLVAGNGPVPTSDQKVKVHYEGRLIDGTVFDSSYKRGQPATFAPSQVIKGWTEALTMMPVGSKWQLYIPEQLGYGSRGAGNSIPPYSTLIFDVEVIGIE